MKNEKDIKSRAKVLILRHLDKLYKKHSKICPENCIYNDVIDYETDKIEVSGKFGKRNITVRNDQIRICKYKNVQELHVCHEDIDAQACFNNKYKDRSFKFKYSKKELKEMFYNILNDKKILSRKYPDVYNLEWVLQEEQRESLWQKIKIFVKERIFFQK